MTHPFKGKSQADKGRARYRAEGGLVERWGGYAANRTPYESDSEAQAKSTVTDRAGRTLSDVGNDWKELRTPSGWKEKDASSSAAESVAASGSGVAASAAKKVAKRARSSRPKISDMGRYRPDTPSGHKRGGRV